MIFQGQITSRKQLVTLMIYPTYRDPARLLQHKTLRRELVTYIREKSIDMSSLCEAQFNPQHHKKNFKKCKTDKRKKPKGKIYVTNI